MAKPQPNLERIPEERYLRVRQVAARTSLSCSTIYREVAARSFPTPFKLTRNTVAWKASEVDTWMESRRRVLSATSEGGIAAVHEARAKAKTNPAWTEATQIIMTQDLADKALVKVSQKCP